ncbi:MAG: DUF2079 domain-containing protein [Bacteroidales bacterium]|nr:DUF2079 domain-containing protein [Bacteroidales bacterium]
MNSKLLSNKITLPLIFTFFAIIYVMISFTNHYLLRTYALDLGMFNHALYSFSHFKMNYFTLDLTGAEINYFGDHFSPIIMLLAPFSYLFGSYTLLIIQIASILIGGYGIFKYASLKFPNTYIPHIITFQFFSIWGIFSALSYDFHSNVVAAMLVPWLLYFYETTNKKAFLAIFFLIIICKENMALWLGFIIIGLVIKRFDAKQWSKQKTEFLKFELPLIVLSFLYFVIVVAKVMPALSHGQGTNQLARYSQLGGSVKEIIISMISNPKYIFTLLFESTLNDGISSGIKSELHFMVLVSGGFALLFKPHYLIMLAPIYLQKLLTNNFVFWGINFQYSIEFAPILSLCLIDFLDAKKPIKLVYGIALLIMATTLHYTIKTIDKRVSLWYDNTNTVFYNSKHYKTQFKHREIKEALKLVPENAIVSTSSVLAPRLAFRDKIYNFPVTKDANYIVLLTSPGNSYPISEEEFQDKVANFLKDSTYTVKYNLNDLLIVEKK